MSLTMRPTGLGSGIDKAKPPGALLRRLPSGESLVEMKAAQPPSVTIRQIEFDREGRARPGDAL